MILSTTDRVEVGTDGISVKDVKGVTHIVSIKYTKAWFIESNDSEVIKKAQMLKNTKLAVTYLTELDSIETLEELDAIINNPDNKLTKTDSYKPRPKQPKNDEFKFERPEVKEPVKTNTPSFDVLDDDLPLPVPEDDGGIEW